MPPARKPNLFIVGAPKCGTTAWVEYLGSHPDIFFAPIKEPHHFCEDFGKYRWVRERDDYCRLFDGSGDASAVGEASVFYLYSHAAAAAIRDFDPDARIIILIRDQEDFLPSLHNQLVFNGDETIKNFEKAWRLSGERDASNTGSFCREPRFLDYKAQGRFDEQVDRYFETFSADQVRVFHFRNWSRDPRLTYLEMLRFLGLEDDGRTDFPPVNEARTRRFNWLTPFLRRPPRALAASLRAVRRITGINTRLGGMLLRTGRKGYVNAVSPAMKEQIRRYYEESNARLEPKIWRPGVSQPRS